jgi:hypothetical protein
MPYARRVSRVCRVCVLLVIAVGLPGCGGSSKRATTPQRIVIKPVHRTPAYVEALRLFGQVRSFVSAHCPCTLRETSTGLKLTHERHP